MIYDMLTDSGISAFAALPVSRLKITKPYLLRDFSPDAYALFTAIPYYVDEPSNLASFAAVPDYHAFADALFFSVSDYIKRKYSKSAEGFADHSPFDEVHGAASCGLGVIGDHGLLITKAHSSFVTVAELVTELTGKELMAEGVPVLPEPMPIAQCGHCGACAAACPTGAIGRHDKTSCLSCVTQKKGELTDDERAVLRRSPYVWGCDACQLACPYTKAAREVGTLETGIPYFRDRHIDEMTEKYMNAMTDEDYAKYTFSWRKRDVMLRNIRLKGDGHD